MYRTPRSKKSINIMGTKIKIKIDEEYCVSQGADGLYKDNVIYLLEEYADRKSYRDVYVHESFHALCDILGLQLDMHTEEILANRVGIMVSSEL